MLKHCFLLNNTIFQILFNISVYIFYDTKPILLTFNNIQLKTMMNIPSESYTFCFGILEVSLFYTHTYREI